MIWMYGLELEKMTVATMASIRLGGSVSWALWKVAQRTGGDEGAAGGSDRAGPGRRIPALHTGRRESALQTSAARFTRNVMFFRNARIGAGEYILCHDIAARQSHPANYLAY